MYSLKNRLRHRGTPPKKCKLVPSQENKLPLENGLQQTLSWIYRETGESDITTLFIHKSLLKRRSEGGGWGN